MKFHVASRGGGSPLTLTFQQGGGIMFKLFQLNNKNISSLVRVLLINLLYLVRQANKFLSFYFAIARFILFRCFYCYNHAGF